MSFSKHANNKANSIYVMGKDYIQKINDTTIFAEKMFYRNFTDPGHKFVLSLHLMVTIVIYLSMVNKN